MIGSSAVTRIVSSGSVIAGAVIVDGVDVVSPDVLGAAVSPGAAGSADGLAATVVAVVAGVVDAVVEVVVDGDVGSGIVPASSYSRCTTPSGTIAKFWVRRASVSVVLGDRGPGGDGEPDDRDRDGARARGAPHQPRLVRSSSAIVSRSAR